MRRGDVYLARIGPRSGAEIRGHRPVVVLSHDELNSVKAWRSIIIVPLSASPRQSKKGPTAVPILDGTAGLRGDGVALCHQITTVDRSKLKRRLGALPEAVLVAIESGVRAALDLD